MTSLGMVLVTMLGSMAIFLPVSSVIPLPALALVTLFLLIERRHVALSVISTALVLVAPIAAYLAVVWIAIAGDPPTNTLFSTRDMTAAEFVAGISVRLGLAITLVHATLGPQLASSPMRFFQEMRLPADAKTVLVMTVALTSTMRVATEKAWASLVAANLLTPGLSFKNFRNAPILVLTIWMFIVGTLSHRMQVKWPLEDMRRRLAEGLVPADKQAISIRDGLWLAAILVVCATSVVMG